jgi:hypothetical protein
MKSVKKIFSRICRIFKMADAESENPADDSPSEMQKLSVYWTPINFNSKDLTLDKSTFPVHPNTARENCVQILEISRESDKMFVSKAIPLFTLALCTLIAGAYTSIHSLNFINIANKTSEILVQNDD